MSGPDLEAPMRLCQRAGQTPLSCGMRGPLQLSCAGLASDCTERGISRSNALCLIEIALAGVSSRAIQCGDRQARGDGSRGLEGLPSEASTAAQRCGPEQHILQVAPILASVSAHAPSGQLFKIANLGTCM